MLLLSVCANYSSESGAVVPFDRGRQLLAWEALYGGENITTSLLR